MSTAVDCLSRVVKAVLVGFLLHSVLDGFSLMGQALLWPLARRRYHLAWPRFRVGSAGETLLTLALLGGLAWWAMGTLPHFLVGNQALH